MNREEYGRRFEESHGRTASLLMSKGVPEEEARDIAQAAWVKGWEHLDQLRDPCKTLVWVNSIAMNRYRSSYRQQLRHQELIELPVEPRINLAAIDIERMLQRCRSCDQEILRKRYLQDEPIGEIADELGCSQTAVRLRLMRARRSLREKCEEPNNSGRPSGEGFSKDN